MSYQETKSRVSYSRGLPDEGLDQNSLPMQRAPFQGRPTAPTPNDTHNKASLEFVKEPLQLFPTRPPPTPPNGGSKKQVTRGERSKLRSSSPTSKSTPNKTPLVFTKEPLQRFPTQGPPTPPIVGSKKQVAREDSHKLRSGSLARLEAEHRQKLAAASVTTTTPRTPSRGSLDGALDSLGTVVDDTSSQLLRENSNNSSPGVVRSGMIQEEGRFNVWKSASNPDSSAIPQPPLQSPVASRSPVSRPCKELLDTFDGPQQMAPSPSKGASSNGKPTLDATYNSDDGDVKNKTATDLSKEGFLDSGIQRLKVRRVNSLQKLQNIERRREGENNRHDEELSAKPGAYRIGENVEQEDKADLEEWRATRRLAKERQLDREAGDYLHFSTDAPGASRSSNDVIALAPATQVNNEKMQRLPQKWWVRALGIALVLATIIGVAVGVSSSNKTGKIAIAAPTNAPSTSAPMTMTPTSLPTLSVNPTISGHRWNQVGVGLAGEEFVQVGVDVSLCGDGSTVAVSSFARTGGVGSTISVASVGTGEWTRVGPDLVLEARATIDLSQDGTWLLVGIPSEQEGQLGRAAVYSWDGNGYIQIGQNLTQTSPVIDESFAKAVCITDDGSRIAIADPIMASVYIYDLVADSWIIIEIITGHDAHAIALSGDGSTIAISSTAASIQNSYSDVFVYSSVDGERWAMVGQALNAADVPYEERASPLALSQNGSVLVAGASLFGKQTQGMVQVFHLDTTSEPVTWKPRGSQILGAELDYLGWSVDASADGSIIAVGLPRFSGVIPGSTHVYELFNGKWRQVGDAIESEEFETPGLSGFSVSIDDGGHRLAIGSPQAENDRGETRSGLALIFELS